MSKIFHKSNSRRKGSILLLALACLFWCELLYTNSNTLAEADFLSSIFSFENPDQDVFLSGPEGLVNLVGFFPFSQHWDVGHLSHLLSNPASCTPFVQNNITLRC
jgi:hypothetical protein